jgi:histidine ammonia-lyase
MSYNYLPVDRKWLNFNQVKNLLDYDQHISITFDAHERILKCREYLSNISPDNSQRLPIDHPGHHRLTTLGQGFGEEVPADVVKLMLMLKIKSISFGMSGVQIETVKRLLELYNNKVIPVVYTLGSAGANGDSVALSHLCLPLIGLGEVRYKEQKLAGSAILHELNWQPLSLEAVETAALVSGSQFTTAYGIYTLKRADQLLRMADLVAALSFETYGCNSDRLTEQIRYPAPRSTTATAAVMLHYLENSSNSSIKKPPTDDPYSFICTPQIHDAVKANFDHVLNIFLAEINSVTEDFVIVPEDKQVITGLNSSGAHLSIAMNTLAVSLALLAEVSEKRMAQLQLGRADRAGSNKKNPDMNTSHQIVRSAVAAIRNENEQLAAPTSINPLSGDSNLQDLINIGAIAGPKCLQLISNIEQVLAIELITGVQAVDIKGDTHTSSVFQELAGQFRQHTSSLDSVPNFNDKITRAHEFIRFYKPGSSA